MKKVPVALVLVLLASFALAACGGSSDSTSDTTAAEPTTESSAGSGDTATGGELKIEAAASGLAFASDTADSEAGKVTLEFNNPQSVPHDVAIENADGETIGKTDVIAEGESTATVELKPGKTYTYFCSVPGHREAGMEGTLTTK
jgi:plastocyanin